MNRYALKTTCGEKINDTLANSYDEAVQFFSILKNLKINDLINIFIVEEILC